MTMLHEQYRPATWAEVIGQDKVIARIRTLARRGLGGRAYWISGASGTGKTTIARLLAAELCDALMIQEVDAAGLSIADLEDIERTAAIYGWGAEKRGRAFIVNEAHALRKPAIEKLLTMLERIQYAEAAATPIEADPIKVVEFTAKRFNFNETEQSSLMRHLIAGGDLSVWGLANAVTATAKGDELSYDRATELESIGGDIIELPKSAWKIKDAKPMTVAAV